MSRHSRRSEQVQATRARADVGLTEKLPGAELDGGDTTASDTVPTEPVGKYWVVIILWTFGFVTLIAFELIAAIFKR